MNCTVRIPAPWSASIPALSASTTKVAFWMPAVWRSSQRCWPSAFPSFRSKKRSSFTITVLSAKVCNADTAYPLTILDYPVAVTFGLYSEFEVMDPDAFEEGLLDDTITVVLGGNNKTISIIKPGGKRISDTLVMTLRGKAAKRYGTVYESVEKFKCDLLTNMKEKCVVCCL